MGNAPSKCATGTKPVAGAGVAPPVEARERASFRDWVERLLPFASVVALFVALSILSPYFLTVQNLSSVARQSAVITVMSLGMTLVMISGGIDLSVGSVMAFAGICVTMMLALHSLLSGALRWDSGAQVPCRHLRLRGGVDGLCGDDRRLAPDDRPAHCGPGV